MSKVRKENGKKNVVGKVVALAAAGVVCMQGPGVHAAEKTTVDVNEFKEMTISQQVELYSKEGMNKLEMAQKILDNENIGLGSIHDEFNAEGDKMASYLRFDIKDDAPQDVGNQIRESLVKQANMKKLIGEMNKNKTSLVSFDFEDYDSEVALDGCPIDSRSVGFDFINLENIDENKLGLFDKFFVRKLKKNDVAGILINNGWYFVSKQGKVSENSVKSYKDLKKCNNLELALTLYSGKKYDFAVVLELDDNEVLNRTYEEGEKITFSSRAYLDSEEYKLNELNEPEFSYLKDIKDDNKTEKVLEIAYKKSYLQNYDKNMKDTIKEIAKVNK